MSGEEAVARAAASRSDLILLDLGLPGFDGLEVIRRVRAFLDATPIIVLSAQGEDETKVRALDLGADDYVVKPFALPELLARVRVGLRHAERGGVRRAGQGDPDRRAARSRIDSASREGEGARRARGADADAVRPAARASRATPAGCSRTA